MPPEEIETTVVAIEQPASPVPSQHTQKEKPLPKEMESMEFDTGDQLLSEYQPEQLPPTDPGPAAKPVAKPTKPVVEPTAKPAAEAPKPTSVLKPPTAKPVVPAQPAKPVVPGKEVITPVTPAATGRDFTGWSPEDTAVGKAMSNQAFERFKALRKENGELSKLKDTTYLQSPDAYVLAPEYRQAQQDNIMATREYEFWNQQLELAKAGKPWTPIKGFTRDTLQPVADGEQQPGPRAEEWIRQRMYAASGVTQTAGQRLNEIKGNFQSRINADLQGINAEVEQRFEWVKNKPELLDYTIEVPGAGEQSLKTIGDNIVSILPAYMQSHPLANVVKNLFIALQVQGAQKRALESNTQVSQVLAAEASAAEPTSTAAPSPKSKGKAFGGVTEFNAAEMPTID